MKQDLQFTILDKPVYWTSAADMADEEKRQYNTHQAEEFSFDGVISYDGQTASVYNDDYGQQEYYFINGTDVEGGCGAYNYFWDEEVASAIHHYLTGKYFFIDDILTIKRG